MIDINELRRLAQAATPGPWKTGQYLGSLRQFVIHTDVGDKGRGSDVAFTFSAFGSDETVANARLIAAANPAAITELLDRLEAAESDAAHQKALADSALRVAQGWERKCGELRAKIEAMEKQEPVATVRINAINGNPSVDFVPGHHYLHHNDRLYLAPGAQPAPSVPEGWKLVPTAESRHPGIYKMLGALHAIDNTRGASEWESYAAMLAVAPEAKP